MSFTEQEKNDIGNKANEIITGIQQAIQRSFETRPMVNITKDEVLRRLDASYEIWRQLVYDAGIEPKLAVKGIYNALIDYIDRQTDTMDCLIKPVCDTFMIPHQMGDLVKSERALSASAMKRGTLPPEQARIIKEIKGNGKRRNDSKS